MKNRTAEGKTKKIRYTAIIQTFDKDVNPIGSKGTQFEKEYAVSRLVVTLLCAHTSNIEVKNKWADILYRAVESGTLTNYLLNLEYDDNGNPV